MKIVTANKSHFEYADIICDTIETSAKVRGTGIAKRTPAYIKKKLESGDAVIALDGLKFGGFCYIETWENKSYVVHSGLIVHPDYRNQGLAKRIKSKIFEYSKEKYPDAKIFGITTGWAVMKINYELGYKPVTFSELTSDEAFWNGCRSCKNYDILERNDHKMCLCTGMLHDPKEVKRKQHSVSKEPSWEFKTKLAKLKDKIFTKKG